MYENEIVPYIDGDFRNVCHAEGSICPPTADTTHIYEINGQRVAHFDGSALVGKTIANYQVKPISNNNSATTVMLHAIATKYCYFCNPKQGFK